MLIQTSDNRILLYNFAYTNYPMDKVVWIYKLDWKLHMYDADPGEVGELLYTGKVEDLYN